MKQFLFFTPTLVPDELFLYLGPWSGYLAVRWNEVAGIREKEPHYYQTFKRYYAYT